QQRLQRARTLHRDRLTEAVRCRFFPDPVFVVVVPPDDAVVEKSQSERLLPPADTLGMREIDVRAPPVPELPYRRLAARCVGHERAACRDLGKGRMIVEQAWLDIGDDAHSR